MKIRRIEIERFRGIKKLDWNVEGDFICLVGPGDSTKSTILDAIELVLSPRWNVQLDDVDFYSADTAEPIRITITVGALPDAIKSDVRFGLHTRGWSVEGVLHDEPEDDDELVLTIRLCVDSSLEPTWVVVTERTPDGKPITAKDRETLGCVRLGEFLDRHFAWGRGSLLTRFTGEPDSLASILATAGRAARAALDQAAPEQLAKLQEASEAAKRAGAECGVRPRSDYGARLDVQAVTVGVGGLSLHDGQVPLRRAGLGTRRLLAVAMQREITKAGAVTLIDEVEYGLEPHRIRHLLRALRPAEEERQRCGPVLMSTHAPVALGELRATEIRVVRSTDGVTTILALDPSLQPVVRKASEAFFARKVLVCEGMTELGFCRRLDQWWAETGPSFGLTGVALVDGRGTEAPSFAVAMARLGYSVALLADSDRPLVPDRRALEELGVQVFLWDGSVALEQRIALDLPWPGVAAMTQLAMDTLDPGGVRGAIAARLEGLLLDLSGAPTAWQKRDLEKNELRMAIGLAAKVHNKGWFKNAGMAEELAGIVIEQLATIPETDLARKISLLRDWAHGDG